MLLPISQPLTKQSVLLVTNISYLPSLMNIISSTTFLYYATTMSFFTIYFLPPFARLCSEVYTDRLCWESSRGLRVAWVPS